MPGGKPIELSLDEVRTTQIPTTRVCHGQTLCLGYIINLLAMNMTHGKEFEQGVCPLRVIYPFGLRETKEATTTGVSLVEGHTAILLGETQCTGCSKPMEGGDSCPSPNAPLSRKDCRVDEGLHFAWILCILGTPFNPF